jgi:hypothetical protein
MNIRGLGTMKIGFWGLIAGLIALNVAALGVMARTANFTLTMILVPSLFLLNILLAVLAHRIPSLRA